jgi:hypothetical protein
MENTKEELMQELATLQKKTDSMERTIRELTGDGSGPCWCPSCNILMSVVRPGKHTCTGCEQIDILENTLAHVTAQRDQAMRLFRERNHNERARIDIMDEIHKLEKEIAEEEGFGKYE